MVTDKEYVVDVTHIRPFYYDPAYVTPLNIVVKDGGRHDRKARLLRSQGQEMVSVVDN